MSYATRDDVFQLGINAKAFVVRPQAFDAIDISTGVIRLKAHGLTSADYITFEVTSGGSLPTGLVAFSKYAVDNVDFDYIRIVNPSTGIPITSYASGGSAWGVVPDPLRRLDRHLEASAGRIDQNLTAHKPPLLPPYPVQVVEVNARLAARRMLPTLQFDNAAFKIAADQLRETAEQDEEQLKIWASGVPVNPRPVDEDTIADNGARASYGRVATDWTRGAL